MMNPHFQYIDRLKGFAMLTVVMGHCQVFVLNHPEVIFNQFLSCIRMPLFMFLSGFVMSNIPKMGKTARRVIALLMPFFIVGFLFTLFCGDSYYNLLSSPWKYGYWYLWVLAVFYGLSQLLRIFSSRVGQIVVAVGILALLYLLDVVMPFDWKDILSIIPLRLFWPFFAIGYFFRQFGVLPWIARHNWTFTVGLVLFIAGFIYYKECIGHLYYPMALSAIIALSYFFFNREVCDSWAERQLAFIGRHSLDIYIYHFFLIRMTHLNSLGGWFSETKNILPELLLCFLFSVAVAYISAGIGMLLRKSVLVNEVIYGGFAKRLLREE